MIQPEDNIRKALEEGLLAGQSVAEIGASLERKAKITGYRQGYLENLPEELREAVERATANAKTEKEFSKLADKAIRGACHRKGLEIRALESQRDELAQEKADINDIVAFMEAWQANGATLGSVNESALHKALPPVRWLKAEGFDETRDPARHAKTATVFLVQHDWSKLLDGTDADDGEILMPFDEMAFEFRINERRVILVVWSDEGAPKGASILFPAVSGRWYGTCFSGEGAHKEEWCGLGKYVRAIAVTLDAEVTTAELVRAPVALNAARIKADKPPIFDHHILTIRRTARADRLDREDGPPTHHKRLHFRRGHWRHYPSHKTWIKWMLVGDPSLGFADKDYRV